MAEPPSLGHTRCQDYFHLIKPIQPHLDHLITLQPQQKTPIHATNDTPARPLMKNRDGINQKKVTEEHAERERWLKEDNNGGGGGGGVIIKHCHHS